MLSEVLKGEIDDLSPEIAHTDSPSYRRELKERREQLRALLVKIRPAA